MLTKNFLALKTKFLGLKNEFDKKKEKKGQQKNLRGNTVVLQIFVNLEAKTVIFYCYKC